MNCRQNPEITAAGVGRFVPSDAGLRDESFGCDVCPGTEAGACTSCDSQLDSALHQPGHELKQGVTGRRL